MGIFLSPGHVLHGMYAIGNDVPPYVEGRFLIYHGKDLMTHALRIAQKCGMLVRHSNDGKIYLYDVIDIKKETSNSLSE